MPALAPAAEVFAWSGPARQMRSMPNRWRNARKRSTGGELPVKRFARPRRWQTRDPTPMGFGARQATGENAGLPVTCSGDRSYSLSALHQAAEVDVRPEHGQVELDGVERLGTDALGAGVRARDAIAAALEP